MSEKSKPAQSRVSVKNVKYAAFASEETLCFDASVYIDGKKVGSVSNGGKGSANEYYPWGVEKMIGEVAATLPPIDMTKFGCKDPLPQSADTLIDDLVQDELQRKDIVKIMSKSLYFRIPQTEYKEGEWTVLKAKTTPDRIKAVIEKYGPTTVILGHNHHKLD